MDCVGAVRAMVWSVPNKTGYLIEFPQQSVTMEMVQNFEAFLPNRWICIISLVALQEPHEKAIQLIWDKLLARANYEVLTIATGKTVTPSYRRRE